MKKNVLVVFGGVSSEHDISLMSARSVIENIPKEQYAVYMLGIARDGRTFLFEGDTSLLDQDTWLERGKVTPAVISHDRSRRGVLVLEDGTARLLPVDVVFPVLHGKNGEDGTIQGLLELAGIPFVGCGAAASAVCMDKAIERSMADNAGIPQAKWCSITRVLYAKEKEVLLRRAEQKLGYPIFVKPARAGSSVGITRAVDRAALEQAAEIAFREDDKIVLEEAVDGLEVECAVLGNEEPIASVVGRIVPSSAFYDFEAKYVSNTSELKIPADISKEKSEEVRALALQAYRAFGCAGLTRVDFFIRRSDGKVLLNEPNTLPGFTSISMYPKLFAASGVAYGELLDRLIRLGLARQG